MRELPEEDYLIISKIAKRFKENQKKYHTGQWREQFALVMDIEAAHRFTPLNLSGLLAADDSNFGHDVAGIVNHLDRKNGILLDCFVPRFAL